MPGLPVSDGMCSSLGGIVPQELFRASPYTWRMTMRVAQA